MSEHIEMRQKTERGVRVIASNKIKLKLAGILRGGDTCGRSRSKPKL
jgi:hypothetical protein